MSLSAGMLLAASIRAAVLCVEDDKLQTRLESRPEKLVTAHITCKRKTPCQRKPRKIQLPFTLSLLHPCLIWTLFGCWAELSQACFLTKLGFSFLLSVEALVLLRTSVSSY